MEEKKNLPIPSATILILSQASEEMEVFMVVRHHQIDFASGALVFPGGKLSQGDYSPKLRGYCQGGEDLTDEELAIQVAAIREAYEESGVLFARTQGSQELVDHNRLADLEHYRDPMSRGEVEMVDFLEKERLILSCDLLVSFAHWVTPEFLPKRFDTYFFLAQAPPSQVAQHDGTELVDSIWITPQQALREEDAGERYIMFPTRMTLAKLDKSKTVEEALKRAKHEDVVTVLPWIEKRGDKEVICIPEEAGYDITEIPKSES